MAKFITTDVILQSVVALLSIPTLKELVCKRPNMKPISRVPDQNGVSQACYTVEIYHSAPEPSMLTVYTLQKSPKYDSLP